MSNKPVIKNEGDPRKYFAMIPHLADRDLNLYSYRLYSHLIHFAGGKEEVEATTKELASATGMSTGKVVEAKRDLAEKGFIDLVSAYRHRIVIKDIWRENMRIFGADAETRLYSEHAEPQTRSPHERVDPKHVHHMNEIAKTRSPHERVDQTRSPHEQHVSNTTQVVHPMNVHQREKATRSKKEKRELLLLDKWELILAELNAGLSPATRGFIEGSQAFELSAFADGSRHYLIVINDGKNLAWLQSQLGRRIGILIQQVILGQRAALTLTFVDRAEFEEVEGIEGESIDANQIAI